MEAQNQIQKLNTAVQYLQQNFGKAPQTALVLGSGLSGFADRLESAENIRSQDIPGAVHSTVVGHSGKLVVGKIKNSRVAVLAGRVHGYEGHSPHQVVHNLRALRLWGVQRFILTNAAGSTHTAFRPGDLVLLKDHLNCTGQNPLIGLELFSGARFPDMSDAYSKEWRARALKIAKKLRISLKQGVYAGLMGPTYETAAEVKMFRKWGADLVGMSTVWECIAVHQMEAKVLGISVVTNLGTGVSKNPLSHQEVLETTQKVQKKFNVLVENLLEDAQN